MKNDIRSATEQHVNDIRSINRDLVEKALNMRCQGYMEHVKSQLLTHTIFEVDKGKKFLKELNDRVTSHEEELQHKNRRLLEAKAELEERVKLRTHELELKTKELERRVAMHEATEEERKKLELQFIQAQKMESIGRLAGGVSHDFNNMLSSILGYCELAMTKLIPGSPVYQDLSFVMKAANRAVELTRQLLAFSRKQVLETKPVDLNEELENLNKMLKRLISEDIGIEFKLNAEEATVLADVVQLEQVMMNLAVNARDAMPKGGKIIIETNTANIDEAYCKLHSDILPGNYLELQISDNGIGMPRDIRDHIFEPFYTTKEEGKGTGLGLSTVYGIIKQHKGSIYVYSEEGSGTTFKILLPLTELKHPYKDTGISAEPVKPGSESILVVDDEEVIRQVIVDSLEGFGYTTYPMENADQALQFLEQNNHKIDLLLTDVVLPGKSGKDLASLILDKYPETRILFMSGYSADIIADRNLLDQGVELIRKPIRPSSLARKIRELLDS